MTTAILGNEMELQDSASVSNKSMSRPENIPAAISLDSDLSRVRYDNLNNRNRSDSFKKRKKDKTNPDESSQADDEDDELQTTTTTTTTTIQNPIELLSSWPSLGRGNHGPGITTHHEWIRLLANEVALLKSSKEAMCTKLTKLENQVKDKDAEIVDLKNRVSILEAQMSKGEMSRQTKTAPTTWSDLVSGGKKSDEVNMMLSVVKNELKKEDKLLQNVIVSGLNESNDKEIEKERVVKLLNELDIDVRKVKRSTRLRKQGVTPNESKPSLLLIEFDSQSTAELALSNAKKLKDNSLFRKVYVNRDKTETDRITEANLRKRRNELNKSLPYVLNEERGLKFGIEEKTNKKFYWSVRNGELAKTYLTEYVSH